MGISNNSTKNPISDYYSWADYWNNVAESGDGMNQGNYVPKTAIIPPVCPMCPQRNNGGIGGVCTGCGGLGGNGTQMQYKNRFSDFLASHGSGYRGNGKWGGSNPSLGQIVDNAGSGIVDVTKTALDNATLLAAGAGVLAEDAGSGAVGLAKDAGSGAVDLAKDAGSGAIGFAKDAGSGATSLLRDAGSGAVGLLKSNPLQVGDTQPGSTNAPSNQVPGAQPNNPYQSGYYSQGTYNLPNNPLGIQGIDPYSYNGALVSKGGNYIPITDDFSAFRK